MCQGNVKISNICAIITSYKIQHTNWFLWLFIEKYDWIDYETNVETLYHGFVSGYIRIYVNNIWITQVVRCDKIRTNCKISHGKNKKNLLAKCGAKQAKA